MATAGYKEKLARLVENLSPVTRVPNWLKVEREFKSLRDPLQIVSLPKLKFLEDAAKPDQVR